MSQTETFPWCGYYEFGLVASLLCYRDYILRYLFRILGISYDSGMMTRKETDRYLQAILSTYHASSKTKKGELLTYSEFITKRPRKSLIRRLRELSAPPPNGDVGIKRVGRPSSYSKSELIAPYWLSMESNGKAFSQENESRSARLVTPLQGLSSTPEDPD